MKGDRAVFQISPDFNWEDEKGQVMNLLLNMMGGLKYQDLTKEEKSLLEKNGYKK